MKHTFFSSAVVLGVLISVHPIRGDSLVAEATDEIRPLITTSDLQVGQNRFAFGLMKDNKLVDGADVTLKLYAIDGDRAFLTSEVKVPYWSVGKTSDVKSNHRHADGTAHIHTNDSAVRGLYVTRINFSRAGDWGIELLVNHANGVNGQVRLAVTVQESTLTPAVGSPAPRSRNLIARDVKNLREIDSSQKPEPRLHQVRIADAIAQGMPQLIVFATPQFCTSRMCGPVVDIVRSLLPIYAKRVAFIHQEIWQDFASNKAFPTVEEWRLTTEPWIFVVDRGGTIRGKFEGLVTVRELEEVLEGILKERSGRRS